MRQPFDVHPDLPGSNTNQMRSAPHVRWGYCKNIMMPCFAASCCAKHPCKVQLLTVTMCDSLGRQVGGGSIRCQILDGHVAVQLGDRDTTV